VSPDKVYIIVAYNTDSDPLPTHVDLGTKLHALYCIVLRFDVLIFDQPTKNNVRCMAFPCIRIQLIRTL